MLSLKKEKAMIVKHIVHSGLQKDVLALYRKLLRIAFMKDNDVTTKQTLSSLSCPVIPTTTFELTTNTPNTTSTITTGIISNTKRQNVYNGIVSTYIKNEFRKQSLSVKRTDYKTIEYMLRKGYKNIKLLQMPGFKMVRGA